MNRIARWRFHLKLIAALREQVQAQETLVRASDEAAERWKRVAKIAEAQLREARGSRDAAQRRLQILRDNMHRERES